MDVVSWRNNLDAAKIEATQSGKLVLLHFYTSTCGPCRLLDQNVFSQPQVGEAIEQNYIPIKINADEASAIAASYRIERVPSEIVLTPQGNVIASLSCPQSPSEYLGQLSALADNYRLHTAGNNSASQAPVQAAYAGLEVGRYAQQPQYSQPTAQANTQAPSMTNNPYAAQQASTQGQMAPSSVATQLATNNSLTNTPASNNVALPANAMPNSYFNSAANQTHVAQASQQTASQFQAQPVQPAVPAPGQVMNPAATQVHAASHIAPQLQLPPGSPPLAFDGYCPIALKSAHRWMAGNPKFGAVHRGRTFLFTGPQQQQQFLANPDAYCPVFSGMDPVMLLDANQVVEGSRRYGFEYRGAFYLFANQDSMNRFKANPDTYAAGVRQAMNRMDSANGGTVLR